MKAEDLLRRAAATTPFVDPLTWYSNGERGHLHLEKGCDKLPRNKQLTTRELTLHDALVGYKLCDSCPRRGIWHRQRESEIISSIEAIADVERRLDNGYLPDDFSPSAHPTLNAAGKRIWTDNLRQQLGDRTTIDPGLHQWWDQVQERLLATEPQRPTREEIEADALNWASIKIHLSELESVLSTLEHGRTDEHNLWDEKATAIFGRPSRQQLRYPDPTGPRRHAVGLLYREWSVKLETTGDPDRARAHVCDPKTVQTILGPVPLEALNSLPAMPLGNAETVGQYAQGIWEEIGTIEIERLVELWHEHILQLRQPRRTMVTPWWGDRGSEPDQNTSLSLRVGTHWEIAARAGCIVGRNIRTVRQNNVGVTVAHPILARALTENGMFGRWSHQGIDVDVVPDDDILATAAALWEPHQRDSSYTLFVSALDAARCI